MGGTDDTGFGFLKERVGQLPPRAGVTRRTVAIRAPPGHRGRMLGEGAGPEPCLLSTRPPVGRTCPRTEGWVARRRALGS